MTDLPYATELTQPPNPSSPAPTYHSTFPTTKDPDLKSSSKNFSKPIAPPKSPVSNPLPPRLPRPHSATRRTTLNILHCALTITLLLIVTIYTTLALGVNLFGALNPGPPVNIIINGAGADQVNVTPTVPITTRALVSGASNVTVSPTSQAELADSHRDPGSKTVASSPRVPTSSRITATETESLEPSTTLITVTRRGG